MRSALKLAFIGSIVALATVQASCASDCKLKCFATRQYQTSDCATKCGCAPAETPRSHHHLSKGSEIMNMTALTGDQTMLELIAALKKSAEILKEKLKIETKSEVVIEVIGTSFSDFEQTLTIKSVKGL